MGNQTISVTPGVSTGSLDERLECDRLSRGGGGDEAKVHRPSMRRSLSSGRNSFSDPMKLIGQQTLEIIREKKAKKKWRRATFLSIVMAVIGFIIMFGVVVVANEFSKELKTSNEAHEMRAPTGELLTVGQAKSYATLFDLPAFDTETLAHLQQLTIVVTPREGGQAHHATLSIVSAMKGLHATSCTLFGASGSKVVIDTQSHSAFAVIDGANYVVHDLETAQQRERRLGAKAVPRLHTEDEFFTAAYGFQVERDAATGAVVRRRLQSESELQGYAEFALVAARGVLDYFSEQDGVDYQTVYMAGTMYADGDTTGVGMHLFYSKADVNSLAMATQTAESSTLFSNRVDNSSALTPFVYMYGAGGKLQECMPARRVEGSPWEAENSTIDEAALSLALHAVGDSLTVVLPGESDDDDWVFVVDTYALDVTFGSYAIFEAPTDDACIATHASPDEEEPPVVTHDGPFVETDPDAAVDALLQSMLNESDVDRRLSSARRLEDVMEDGKVLIHQALARGRESKTTDEDLDAMEQDAKALQLQKGRRLSHAGRTKNSASSKEMFNVGAYAAYGGIKGDTCKNHKHKSTCRSYNHRTFAVCENANAKAIFTVKYKGWGSSRSMLVALSFAGTDDGGDAMADLNYFVKTGPSGTKYHGGFLGYVQQLAPCINPIRDALRRDGIELDFITGHSLGGAAATVYAQEYGEPLVGVATWGAPKTNYGSSGSVVKGWRFWHEDDVVSGNLCAVNGLITFLCPICGAIFSAANGGCPLSQYRHKVSKSYEYYDKLVCDGGKARSAANRIVGSNRCRWWQWGCHASWAARWAAAYARNLCTWRKKRKSVYSTKAYSGWYILNAGVHTKYGEWEHSWSRTYKTDYSVITMS